MNQIGRLSVCVAFALSGSVAWSDKQIFEIGPDRTTTEDEIIAYAADNDLGSEGFYIRSTGDVSFSQKLFLANASSTLFLQSLPSLTTPVGLRFTQGLASAAKVRVESTNMTLRVASEATFQALVTQTAGTAIFENATVTFGTDSAPGEYKLAGNNSTVLNPAVVQLTNAVWRQAQESPAGTSGGLSVAGANAGSHAIFIVEDGSTVTDRIVSIGGVKAAMGAFYQYGGDVVNAFASDSGVGVNGSGYQELNGGTFTEQASGSASTFIQSGDALSYGAFVQTGGTYTGNAIIGRAAATGGSDALVYIGGGTFRNGKLTLGARYDATHVNGAGGSAWFTVSGPSAVAETAAMVALGGLTNYTAQINLNDGGTLKVTGTSGLNACLSSASTTTVDRDSLNAELNFNGGVLAVAVDSSNQQTLFRKKEVGNLPDAMTVYEKGAVFDVAEGNTLGVNAPLACPSGNGVASITLPLEAMNAAGFILPPRLRITGGGGVGASARVVFDSRTRTLTGVEITNPGSGYTSEPTVEVLVPVKDESNAWALSVVYTGTATLAPNATTGGVTKRGAGTLRLGLQNDFDETVFSNTFGGALSVEEGTVELLNEQALPSGNAIVVRSGATLLAKDLALAPETLTVGGSDYTITAANVSPARILVDESCTIPMAYYLSATTWSFDAQAVKDGAVMTIDASEALSLASLASVTLENADGFVLTEPQVIVSCAAGFTDVPADLTSLFLTDKLRLEVSATAISLKPRLKGLVMILR